MIRIGLLCEGTRDQAVIEQVLIGYFADQPGTVRVKPHFPPEVSAAGDVKIGGWTVLKRKLLEAEHRVALGFNDYLVIQIDTDTCDLTGFDVPRKDSTTGADHTPDTLRAAVIGKLTEWMGQDFITNHGDRVFFAVAVDAIECWLLPLLVDGKAKQQKTAGCLDAANTALRKEGRPLLKTGAGDAIRPYSDAARDYRKRKTLLDKGPRNPSLAAFIADLDAAAIIIAPDDDDD